MSTYSPIELSQELLDEIVGNLHDDNSTLRILSITSSKFLPTCRELLFYSLQLRPGNHTRWDGYLEESPHLRSAIKRVDIRVGGFLDTPDAEDPVARLLGRLSDLRTIRLTNPRRHTPLLWTRMPIWLQSAIARIIAQPTVHTITLITFSDIPLSMFADRSPLKKFQSIYCHFSPNTTERSTDLLSSQDSLGQGARHNRTKLETLFVSGSHGIYSTAPHPIYDFLDHPWFPFDLTHLTRLQVELIPEAADKIQQLLTICATTLHGLSLLPKGASVSLQQLSALRVLEISLTIANHAMDEQRMTPILTGVLRTLESLVPIPRNLTTKNESQYGLEEIYLPISVNPTCFQTVPSTFWTDLDSILVKLSSVRVRIEGTSYIEHRDQMPDWRRLLPRLEESRRLTLTAVAKGHQAI